MDLPTPIQQEIDQAVSLARTAARRILEFYVPKAEMAPAFRSPGLRSKGDGSPVTLADKASNDILVAGLASAFPHIPIISEEAALPPFEQRRTWNRFFLVDPLDGTKEFIAGRDEFCVNIGLVQGLRPLWGAIVLPVSGDVYYGGRNLGAFHCPANQRARPIRTARRAEGQGLRVILSRSHPSPGMDAALEKLNVAESLKVGGAVKFCRIAEGAADLYQRFNPTMEWDTAAGQAIVEGAGGYVVGLEGGEFLYNKENLKNPGFVCRG